jgi:hypothetical protein
MCDVHRSTWLHIWTGNIHDINVTDNFADTHAQRDAGKNCPVTGTVVYSPGKRTTAAQAIVSAAGAPASKASRWQ